MILNSKKERPFLGHAINKQRQLRYTSVSQVKTFDPLTDGGCNRKWAFSYRFGIKLARTEALKKGSSEAEKLELYLRTGEDVLGPVLEPSKKFWPTPGSDLECEEPLGNIAAAVELRDMLLKGKHPANIVQSLQQEIEKHAGLTFAGIPIDGAADCRHTRGEYVDSDGILKKDPADFFVVHIDDLKVVSQIYPRKVQSGPNAGTIIPAYTKTDAEVCEDPQMLGYARHAINHNPGMTHARLSLIYANKRKREAVKRTGLISVETVLARSQRLDEVVGKMIQVATAEKIEDIEPNTNACDSFTHVDPTDPTKTLKGCGYRYQCPIHISQVVSNMLGTYKESSMSLCDSVPGTTPSAPAPVVQAPPAPPAAPPLINADHAAAVEAEKMRLLGLAPGQTAAPMPAPMVQAPAVPQPPAIPAAAPPIPTPPIAAASMGFCPRCGTPLSPSNTSKSAKTGEIRHVQCPAEVQAAPVMATALPAPVAPVAPAVPPAVSTAAVPPPLPTQSLISVNPPDQPRGATLVDAAVPPPAGEIQQVDDPELRAKLEQHARDHAAKAAAEASRLEAEKVAAGTSVWCPGGNISIEVTGEMAVAGGHTCACTKTFKGKPFKEGTKKVDGKYMFAVPKHKPKNKETQETQEVQTTMPMVATQAPSIPVPAPAVAPQAPIIPQAPPVPQTATVATTPIPEHCGRVEPIAPATPTQQTTNGHTNGHTHAAPVTKHAFLVEMESGMRFAIINESTMKALQTVAGRIEGEVKAINKLDGYVY